MCNCFNEFINATTNGKNENAKLETTEIRFQTKRIVIPTLCYSVKKRRLYSDEIVSEHHSFLAQYCPFCGEKWIPGEK